MEVPDVVNVFPRDYKAKFEVAQSIENSNHAPLLLIPGVCGSKLIAKNKKTNQADYAWLNTSYFPFSIASKLAEYLWGFIDDDLTFKSYVDEFAEIQAIPGLKGCDKLLDIGILDSKYLENVNIGKYFGPFAQYLCNNFGYKVGVDIFAFSYDWRQSPANLIIEKELSALVKEIHDLTGKKVTIVAHSMGGIVADCYMKMHPSFTKYVSKFIALAVPFDGCGGFSLEALLLGYCLKLPLPRCAAKGIEAIGGCAACLHERPNGKSPATPCVFVKKLQEPESSESSTFQRVKESVVNTVGLLRESPSIVESIEFDESVFGTDIPDVCFCIAKRLYERIGFGLRNAYETYKKLEEASRRGSIIINGDLAKISSEQFIIQPDEALEENFIKSGELDVGRTDFEWECYSVWSDFGRVNRKYAFSHPQIEFLDHIARFPHKLFSLIEKGVKDIQGEISDFKLIDYAQALQFHREFLQKHEPLPEHLRKPQLSVTACLGKQAQGNTGPWACKESREAVKERSIFQLLEQVHQPDSFEGFLYGVDERVYDQLIEVRGKPISIPDNCGFRFYSLSGYGIDTPLHLVYSKPVYDYEELLIEKPEYVMVDGDGTVFLTGALSDEFSDNISKRIIMKGAGHFSMMADQRAWDVIAAWLED